MTTVTLVNFSQLLWKPKPPREEPYFDSAKTLNTKIFSLEVVSDQCLMDSRKWVKEMYGLYRYQTTR